MIHRASAVAAIILGVAVLASPGRGDEKAAANAKARLDAARKTYEGMFARWRTDPSARLRPEDFYSWSRRWMDAEREVADKPEARVAAAQAHLDRMTKCEQMVRRKHDVGLDTFAYEVTGAEFYRLEAERWLAEAKAR
jgi:hypothetical protein